VRWHLGQLLTYVTLVTCSQHQRLVTCAVQGGSYASCTQGRRRRRSNRLLAHAAVWLLLRHTMQHVSCTKSWQSSLSVQLHHRTIRRIAVRWQVTCGRLRVSEPNVRRCRPGRKGMNRRHMYSRREPCMNNGDVLPCFFSCCGIVAPAFMSACETDDRRGSVFPVLDYTSSCLTVEQDEGSLRCRGQIP